VSQREVFEKSDVCGWHWSGNAVQVLIDRPPRDRRRRAAGGNNELVNERFDYKASFMDSSRRIQTKMDA